jgi:hypothetical protein
MMLMYTQVTSGLLDELQGDKDQPSMGGAEVLYNARVNKVELVERGVAFHVDGQVRNQARVTRLALIVSPLTGSLSANIEGLDGGECVQPLFTTK